MTETLELSALIEAANDNYEISIDKCSDKCFGRQVVVAISHCDLSRNLLWKIRLLFCLSVNLQRSFPPQIVSQSWQEKARVFPARLRWSELKREKVGHDQRGNRWTSVNVQWGRKKNSWARMLEGRLAKSRGLSRNVPANLFLSGIFHQSARTAIFRAGRKVLVSVRTSSRSFLA